MTGRTLLWRVLFAVGLDRPLIGHGLGVFLRPEVMSEYSAMFGWGAKSSHNSFLDLFLGVGLLGLGGMLMFVARTVATLPTNDLRDPEYRAAVCGILICLGYGMSESGALLSNSFVWLALVGFLVRANIGSSKGSLGRW